MSNRTRVTAKLHGPFTGLGRVIVILIKYDKTMLVASWICCDANFEFLQLIMAVHVGYATELAILGLLGRLRENCLHLAAC